MNMQLMVDFGLKGVGRVKIGFLERHGRSAIEIVLIVLDALSYLMGI